MTDTSDRCGLGIRGVAMTIDSVVWFMLFFVATFPIAVATGQLETTASGLNADLEGAPASAAFMLWLALGLGYHTIAEWRYGKTIGKHLVGIRAVNEDGSPLSLRTSVIRNGLRLIDFLPFFYIVGTVALLISDGDQRLGDKVGGTIVVR